MLGRAILAVLITAVTPVTAMALRTGSNELKVQNGSATLSSTGTSSATSKVVLDDTPTIKTPIVGSVLFANLPSSPAQGTLIYCSNCARTNPCSQASGTGGALARYLGSPASRWDCSSTPPLSISTYTQTGAWSRPPNFSPSVLTIWCVGGGGGGAQGRANSTGGTAPGGGGGAAGAVCQTTMRVDDACANVGSDGKCLSIVPGAGGNGQTVASSLATPGTDSNVFLINNNVASTVSVCFAPGGYGPLSCGTQTASCPAGAGRSTTDAQFESFGGGAGSNQAGGTSVVPRVGLKAFSPGGGGGGGGGVAAGGTQTVGGNGMAGNGLLYVSLGGKSGSNTLVDGNAGSSATGFGFSTGAGGGGGAGGVGTTAAGKGGDGGTPGGGGGGGGGSISTGTPGNGGNGGAGRCIIVAEE